MNHLGQLSVTSSQSYSSAREIEGQIAEPHRYSGNLIGGLWTDAIIEKLSVLFYERKLSAREIATQLGEGFTRNAVCGKLHRLGFRRARPGRHPSGLKQKRRRRTFHVVADNPERKRAKVRLAPSYRLRAVEIDPLHVTLDQLETHHCRYPYGDGPFTFCGHPKQDDSSYCAAHHGLCRYEERRS